jgi:hypothetical protein
MHVSMDHFVHQAHPLADSDVAILGGLLMSHVICRISIGYPETIVSHVQAQLISYPSFLSSDEVCSLHSLASNLDVGPIQSILALVVRSKKSTVSFFLL